MKKPTLFSRLASKSLKTIAFRGAQELRLSIMHRTDRWKLLERRINGWAKTPQALSWNLSAPFAVLSADGKEALCEAQENDLIECENLIKSGEAVQKQNFSIFETNLPRSGPWPWLQDWRFDHEWQQEYFRRYVHDKPRSRPYDVKFPWELSRLVFLQRMIQADILSGKDGGKEKTFNILRDWKDKNPLAYSVNWYPMEGAMRGIGLCIVSDMVRQLSINSEEASLLLELLAQHGEFVMRTIELTDNAGNHYSAELVALLLIGQTLKGYYPAAKMVFFRFKEAQSRNFTTIPS